MIYLAKVYFDGSNQGRITGTRELEDNEIYDAKIFKPVSESLFDYINEKVNTGDLLFPDTAIAITEDLVTFEAFDELLAVVNNALHAYQKVELRNDIDYGLDLYISNAKFTVINNRFLSKGFFFTPDNKESIYLDVLNSGDTELIELLEEYVEVFEEVTSFDQKINIYIALKKELNECGSVQEIQDVYASHTARNMWDDINY